MALFVQVLCFLVILAIGAVVLKFSKPIINTRSVVLTATLVLLSLVLLFVTITVPFFGFPSLKVGFSQLPLMLLGAFLGPFWAFWGGIAQDILGLFTDPTNYPFFGFTLNKIVIGLIAAFWFSKSIKISQKNLLRIAQVVIGGFYLLAFIILWQTNEIVMQNGVFVVEWWLKVLLSVLLIAFAALLIIGMQIAYKKYQDQTESKPIAKWIIAVIAVEFIVNFCLTPFWLDIMYGIPFMASLAIRVVKGSIMIFANVVVGYILYELVAKLMKRNLPKQVEEQ